MSILEKHAARKHKNDGIKITSVPAITQEKLIAEFHETHNDQAGITIDAECYEEEIVEEMCTQEDKVIVDDNLNTVGLHRFSTGFATCQEIKLETLEKVVQVCKDKDSRYKKLDIYDIVKEIFENLIKCGNDYEN